MAEKSYMTNHDSVKSFTNLNYVDLNTHEKIWKNIIDSHAFNQAVTVFLPTCSINVANEYFNKSLGSYYQVEAPLSLLLEPSFFDLYIKSDQYQLMMHSIETNLNSDDVVVLNPDGKLYLSLVKNTYETFGMEGIKRTKMDVKHDKHIIMVDLKSPNFKSGSKQYDRLKWCLENTLTATFKMVFCATDTLTGITMDIQWPSSTKSIVKMDMEPELETLTDINIPSFQHIGHDISQSPLENWDNEAMEALEWLGLAHLKASRIKKSNKELNPFISVYQTPNDLLKSQTGTLVKWKGFIPTSVIQNTMIITRKMMASGVTSEWTSLSVWGYKDSPYTWNKVQHYHYLNGENDYTFLLLPKVQSAYTYQLYGSHHIK
ncbi:hypothetical protein HPULCUR_009162 [Helicostylum pulchrum]|uniref:Uncharacterized protein n=1 Tax=Helicostylum pulchrum TaxID=562976 RepID=A0ABP9Y9M6_9FUNG